MPHSIGDAQLICRPSREADVYPCNWALGTAFRALDGRGREAWGTVVAGADCGVFVLRGEGQGGQSLVPTWQKNIRLH